MSPAEPTPRSASRLLSALDECSVSERMRALALHARDHGPTPELARLLAELTDSGHPRTALHMAVAARETGTVARFLAGPDHDLRRQALGALRTVAVPDDAVAPVLHDAPTGLRRCLYRTLYLTRRHELADYLLDRVRHEHGDREAAALLPACSPQRVTGQLPELCHAVGSWRRLARRHPDILAGFLEEQAGGRLLDRTWGRALAALDPVRPQRIARLVDIGTAARFCPRANRLRPEELQWRQSYPARYPELPDGSRSVGALRSMIRARAPEAGSVLQAMPWTERRRHLAPYLDRSRTRPPVALFLLQFLPEDRAVSEARDLLERFETDRFLQRRRVDPDSDLDAVAYLPVDEARQILTEASSAGDAQRRARGLARLVEALARAGGFAELARLLTGRADRLRAERDPVRRELWQALAGIRPRALADHCLPALHTLLTDTLRARDTSAGTRRELRGLAASMLRHPATRDDDAARHWALDVYVGLLETFGADGLAAPGRSKQNPPWWTRGRGRSRRRVLEPTLDQVLPVGLEDELLRRAEPVLSGARERGDHGPAVALAGELGRRGHQREAVRESLRAAVLAEPGERAAAGAADLLMAAPGGKEDVLALAEADPRTAHTPAVWARLLKHAPPDRIVAVFDAADRRRAEDGRVWLPDLPLGVVRDWPAPLRARAAEYLSSLARDPARTVAEREAAVLGLGRLPGAAERLRPFLAEQGPDVLREAALSALGHSRDPGTALGLILEHAVGPASRAAGPAMGRCAQRIPPSRLGPPLQNALNGPAKVTIRKTAARLLEQHRPPGALEDLAQAVRSADLHRDVRAAVAGALARALDRPEALEALEAAVPGFSHTELQRAVLAPPPQHCPPAVRARFADVLATLPDPGGAVDASRLDHLVARWTAALPGALDRALEALRDPGRHSGRPLRVLALLKDEEGVGDRCVDLLEHLLAIEPGPGRSGPVFADDYGRIDDTGIRTTRVCQLLIREVFAVHGASTAERLEGRLLELLAAHPGNEYRIADLVRQGISRRLRNGEIAPERVADRLAHAVHLASTDPWAVAEGLTALAESLGTPFGRAVVPEEFLTEVITGLLDRLPAQTGNARTLTGHLAVRLIASHGQAARWAGPWPELLDRAARSDDPSVRGAAWKAVRS